MKKILILAGLLVPISFAQAAHNKVDSNHLTGQKISKHLKHKITPRHNTRKNKVRKVKRKKPLDIHVKVNAAQQYTVELLVTCRKRHVLLTYNKIDKKFCTKKYKCHTSLRRAVRPYCKR